MKIKVMMDYCADPVWDRETGENLDINTIPMSDKLKDKFESFRKYWEFVHPTLNEKFHCTNYKRLIK